MSAAICSRLRLGRRGPAPLRLGPEGGDVLERRGVVDVAGIPRVVAGAHVSGANLAFRIELARDRHADHVQLARHDVGGVQGDRLGERRQPDARRKRRRLVVHVDDVRFPLPPGVFHDPRLDHVEHVAVAVVVVADELLVEAGHRLARRRRAGALHVPLRSHLVAVWIDRRPQHQDDVAEHLLDVLVFGVETRQQVVEQQRRVLGAGELRRVQAAVDVDERLAFTRQPAGLLIGQSFRMRQPARDLTVAVDALEILLRRHQREVIGPPLRRGAGFDQPHVVRCGVDFLEVVDHLVVRGELVVGARLEAEDGRRRRQPALRGKGDGEQGARGRRETRACDALAKMMSAIGRAL